MWSLDKVFGGLVSMHFKEGTIFLNCVPCRFCPSGCIVSVRNLPIPTFYDYFGSSLTKSGQSNNRPVTFRHSHPFLTWLLKRASLKQSCAQLPAKSPMARFDEGCVTTTVLTGCLPIVPCWGPQKAGSKQKNAGRLQASSCCWVRNKESVGHILDYWLAKF